MGFETSRSTRIVEKVTTVSKQFAIGNGTFEYYIDPDVKVRFSKVDTDGNSHDAVLRNETGYLMYMHFSSHWFTKEGGDGTKASAEHVENGGLMGITLFSGLESGEGSRINLYLYDFGQIDTLYRRYVILMLREGNTVKMHITTHDFEDLA